jgi:hypothetical protein
MRALRATARDFYNRRVLVLAPTGQAVDVAVRGGAGDTGMTIAKALKDRRESRLRLHPNTLVVVDEAAMVGTSELRELRVATTAAGIKTVLVGDAHQLAPVKARGGMFAQFCADLPWAQQLCEVWRMRDPEERSASLALRDGGPAPRRRAVEWSGTQHMAGCTPAIRSRCLTTPSTPTRLMSTRARMRCWCVTPQRCATPSTGASTTRRSRPIRPPSPQLADSASRWAI